MNVLMPTPHAEPKTRLHRFTGDVSHISLPRRFTFPFHYTPHPLCKIASEAVQNYLTEQIQWETELQEGKMFGVLVVKDKHGKLGFLAAFSGLLAEQNDWPYFVPPIYDLLQPGNYFKEEEAHISALNKRIDDIEHSDTYKEARTTLEQQMKESAHTLLIYKEEMQRKKNERELRRLSPLSPQEAAELIRESQFQKAEFKRIKQRLNKETSELQAIVNNTNEVIEKLKSERKIRSAKLQQWLFHQFRVQNSLGESKDLFTIFQQDSQKIPPAGSGECAAPKMLQYAFSNEMTPLCMAEFWYGKSPSHEIRRHGQYYPACKSKCEPILQFMLQGLETDPNPLEEDKHCNTPLTIVYEDQWIVVVNKPAGMLSVPGKQSKDSVLKRLKSMYPTATGPLLVHRLDMDTSGLLIATKDKETHKLMQKLFHEQKIKKRYTAILEGNTCKSEGIITLPIRPDYTDRPRQVVDVLHGKPALTHYQVISQHQKRTLTAFYPVTGRTHQLRVHAAHPQGLNCPIVGDVLYGQKADRLYLHAASLTFLHPITGKEITITKEADWL